MQWGWLHHLPSGPCTAALGDVLPLREMGSIPHIPPVHPNPSPQHHHLCSLSLTSVLFVPRFRSPGGGCTTPARVSPAWPAYGLLPANSNVYRASEKKTSFFSRSYSALERATHYSFSCYCDEQGTHQGKPFTIPSCLTNIKTGDEILCCSGQGFQEGLVKVDAFILG